MFFYVDFSEGTGRGIAKGLAACGLARKDLFVTTKIWNYRLDYQSALDACHSSLEKLGLSIGRELRRSVIHGRRLRLCKKKVR